MAELIAQNLAPIMFAALVVFLLLGYPVAFALAANGLLFFITRGRARALRAEHHHACPGRSSRRCRSASTRTMSNEVLLAIPFFTFMGLILERSGMAEDLLDTIGQLFGTRARRPRLRGDLRRRAARGDDRRRRRIGHLDGPDLAARSCCATATTGASPPA